MTYNEFMQSKFIQCHSGVLDDDIPDTFVLWLDSLDRDTVDAYKREYMNDEANRALNTGRSTG